MLDNFHINLFYLFFNFNSVFASQPLSSTLSTRIDQKSSVYRTFQTNAELTCSAMNLIFCWRSHCVLFYLRSDITPNHRGPRKICFILFYFSTYNISAFTSFTPFTLFSPLVLYSLTLTFLCAIYHPPLALVRVRV